MIVFRIRSRVLRAEGHKVEGVNRTYIEQRLDEIKQRDPQAKVLRIEVPGR